MLGNKKKKDFQNNCFFGWPRKRPKELFLQDTWLGHKMDTNNSPSSYFSIL